MDMDVWIEHRMKEKAKCRRTRRSPLPAKFPAIANELGRRETQLQCYKDILLTGSLYKIF